jgi:hypothetical protein
MKTVWRGRVQGKFIGSLGGSVYVLSDGSWWRQQDYTSEFITSKKNPKARLLADDDGRTFLDVAGMSLSVWVVPAGRGLRLYAGGIA